MATRRITTVLTALCLALCSAMATACPEGTWPRNQHDGPGGGLYTGPGGGLYDGPGGGMHDGPTPFCSNIPPWPVFLEYLSEHGYDKEAGIIRAALASAGQ